MSEEEKEKVVARVLNYNNNYWIYHKNYIDEGID